MKTIDMTPSWSGVLPMLLAAYSDGSVEGIDIAQQELERMAALADRWVDYSSTLEEPVQAEQIQAESVANDQPQSVKRASKSQKVRCLIAFVNIHPVGTVLEVYRAKKVLQEKHYGLRCVRDELSFDYSTSARALRAVIGRGLLRAVRFSGLDGVEVVAHSGADSVANAQRKPVRRLSKSQKIIDLLEFVNSQPIGNVLEIATSQYAGQHGAMFDYRSTAPAVRSMIHQGFLEGESCFRFYRVTVVAHCYWEDEEV